MPRQGASPKAHPQSSKELVLEGLVLIQLPGDDGTWEALGLVASRASTSVPRPQARVALPISLTPP